MTKTNENSRFPRQKLRIVILILSFILVPATIVYLSPLVILIGAYEGVATGSMLLFIGLFLLSFFVSRMWCGWLCPSGAWQEICSPIIKRKVRNGFPDMIKYIITALWLIFIAILFITAGGIRKIDPFYGTVNGISVSSVQQLVPVAIIFLLIFVVAFLAGRRGFCHLFCPVAALMIGGRKLRNYFGWRALGLDSDPGLCIDCKKCTRSCPMGLEVNEMVKAGQMENSECILCLRCTDTCPVGAISQSISRFTRPANK